jgi:hypothetical protein
MHQNAIKLPCLWHGRNGLRLRPTECHITEIQTTASQIIRKSASATSLQSEAVPLQATKAYVGLVSFTLRPLTLCTH